MHDENIEFEIFVKKYVKLRTILDQDERQIIEEELINLMSLDQKMRQVEKISKNNASEIVKKLQTQFFQIEFTHTGNTNSEYLKRQLVCRKYLNYAKNISELVNFDNLKNWLLKSDTFYLSDLEVEILNGRIDILLRSLNNFGSENSVDWVRDWVRNFGVFEEGFDFIQAINDYRYENMKKHNILDVKIYSYFDSGIGLGRFAQSLYQSLTNNSYLASIDIQKINLPHRRNKLKRYEDQQLGTLNIFVMGIDQPENLDLLFNLRTFRSKYNVLIPFWESSDIPDEKLHSLKIFDEIWAPTKFIEGILKSNGIKNKISRLPFLQSNSIGKDSVLLNKDLKMSPYLVCIADISSGLERKNILGTLEIFLKYKELHRSEVSLVLKVYNSHVLNYDQELKMDEIRKICQTNGIRIIDEYIASEKIDDLIANAIAYISLHRSEGLGLSIIQAMKLGTKVVTTAYGGNMDFCDEKNSYLVSWRESVPSFDKIYINKGYWAEPDKEDAIRRIHEAVSDYKKGDNTREVSAFNFMKSKTKGKLKRMFFVTLMKAYLKNRLKSL
jgi:glycosyltransferase involved in cell wall biosynthesis